MPDSTRIITDPDEIQKILNKAMTFSEFGQYVKNNIPYDEYVFGIGKVKYTPIECLTSDSWVVLEPDHGPDDARRDPWFWGGAAWGGFSFYKSWVAFDQYNSIYWKHDNGGRIGQNLISNSFEQSSAIKKIYRKSAENALSKAKPLNNVAKIASRISLVIPIASSLNKRKVNLEDTTDFIFAVISFVPGVGWVISGIYTVVDTISVVTTGNKAVTNADKAGFTRWVEFQNALRNRINNLVPTGYYIPY